MAFPQLAARESVPVRRPRVPDTIRVDVRVRVRLLEERRAEEAALRVGQLRVGVARHEQVDAVAQVAHEADLVDQARGGGDEGQGGDEGRDEQGEFLRDHPAHADADDVQVAGSGFGGGACCPLEVVEEVEDVARHFRRRVARGRLRRGAHAAVVEDQAAVGRAVRVAEVPGLPPPGRLEGAQAHDPLVRRGG